jgi:hypothetical protein
VKQLRAARAEKVFRETASGEGRDSAKAQGVKMGRKPKLTDHQKREAVKRREQRWRKTFEAKAFRSLTPAPRAAYLEILNLFTGHNNGALAMPARQLATRLGSKNPLPASY